MATVTFGLLNYTSISTAESTTGWTVFDTLDPDFALEGSNAITGTVRSNLQESYYTNGTALTAVGKHVRMWINTINKAYMLTEASGGYEFLMYDGTSTDYEVMFGSDTYNGGWVNYVVDTALFTGVTLANVTRWGIRPHHSSNSKNFDNTWVDYLRYLDGYYFTGGTSGDEIDLALIAARDADDGAGTLRGYGIVTVYEGVYFCTGKLTIGNSTTTTYFSMDGNVLVYSDNSVATDFYEFTADGTVAVIDIVNSVIQSAGTTDNVRFVLDFSNTSVTVSLISTVIQRAAAINFATGQTIEGNTFNDCDVISPNGATLTSCNIINSAATSALTTTSLDVLDDCSFTSAGTGHAVTVTALGTGSMAWDCNDSGYAAIDGSTGNETIYVNVASGTLTVNVGSGYTTPTIRTAGAVVTVVAGAVTVKATATLKDGTPVASARVYLKASDGTGPFPFEDTVTITRSTTTATVSHTAHGMATNDKIVLEGITDKIEDNYVVKTITVTGVNAYTYTTTDSGSVAYTGTIKSTFVALSTTTDVNGEASISRVYTSDQPVVGWTRKASASPYLQEGVLVGTIDSGTGFNGTAVMLGDE